MHLWDKFLYTCHNVVVGLSSSLTPNNDNLAVICRYTSKKHKQVRGQSAHFRVCMVVTKDAISEVMLWPVIFCCVSTFLDFFLRSHLFCHVSTQKLIQIFYWVFFSAASYKKDTKNGAAVTSLRTFVRSSDFNSKFGSVFECWNGKKGDFLRKDDFSNLSNQSYLAFWLKIWKFWLSCKFFCINNKFNFEQTNEKNPIKSCKKVGVFTELIAFQISNLFCTL